MSPPLTNIRRAHDPFFGRAEDLLALRRAFDGGAQLLTLVGPPGAGKTRLALELARAAIAAETYDAVWFFDLAPVRTLEEAVVRVARVLGAAPAASMTLSVGVVLEAIRSHGRVLVVFDNFEQMVDVAASQISAWVDELPLADIVVTSQIRLGVPAERAFELSALTGEEARELLMERAASVRHGVAVDASEEAVDRLLERLDGLPLAIELAAARVGLYGIDDAAELGSGDLWAATRAGLAGDSLDRHATMGAAISWAWHLLDVDGRRSLASLSLFQGAFTPRSGVELIGRVGIPNPEAALHRLRERSLISSAPAFDAAGRSRVTLYQCVRDFARELLVEDEARSEIEEAFVSLMHETAVDWMSSAPTATLADQRGVAAERDSLEVAARMAESARAADLLAALHELNVRVGPIDAGYALAQDLAQSAPVDSVASMRIARVISDIHLAAGRFDRALETTGAVMEAAEALGDPAPLSSLVYGRAAAMYGSGRGDEALVLLERTLALAAADGDVRLQGAALERIGAIATGLGDYERAGRRLGEALKMQQDAGFLAEEANTRHSLVNFSIASGKFAEAERHAERAVRLAEEVGSAIGLSQALGMYAIAVLERGISPPPVDAVERGVMLNQTLGLRNGLAGAHLFRALVRQEIGELVGAESDLGHALELFGGGRPEHFVRAHLGLLHLESGDHVSGTAGLELGVDGLKHVGDRVFSARFDRALAVCYALRGMKERAEERIEAFENEDALSAAENAALSAAVQSAVLVSDARLAAAESRGTDQQRALEQARRLLSEDRPSPPLIARVLLRVVGLSLEPRAVSDDPPREEARAPQLRVAADHLWFQLDGDPVHIARRKSLRGILAALVDKRLTEPGLGLTREELFAAG